MPFLMKVDDAAEALKRGIYKGKFEIAFPTRFVLLLKFFRILPYSIYFPMIKKFAGRCPMAERIDHLYNVITSWRGSTGAGYEEYPRTHEVSAPPAKTAVVMSSDPTFRGTPRSSTPSSSWSWRSPPARCSPSSRSRRSSR